MHGEGSKIGFWHRGRGARFCDYSLRPAPYGAGLRSQTKSAGFTLIEILAVAFIIGILSTVILLNFRQGQEGGILARAAALLESDIRRAQNLAIASSEFKGSIPCGYGINYVDASTYRLYAGQEDSGKDCQRSDRNFEPKTDQVYQDIKIIEPRVRFGAAFSDIFFEPPDPKIYINNSSTIGVSTDIVICIETDFAKCRTLTVDTAGRIEIK